MRDRLVGYANVGTRVNILSARRHYGECLLGGLRRAMPFITDFQRREGDVLFAEAAGRADWLANRGFLGFPWFLTMSANWYVGRACHATNLIAPWVTRSPQKCCLSVAMSTDVCSNWNKIAFDNTRDLKSVRMNVTSILLILERSFFAFISLKSQGSIVTKNDRCRFLSQS